MRDPELVKAFKAARKLLASGKSDYICFALRKAHGYGREPWSRIAWKAPPRLLIGLRENITFMPT